jgi:serine protease inhibitor
MGMAQMINKKATTFDNIAQDESGKLRPLSFDFILHEAVIRVDEEGTEAAAATGINMVSMSMAVNANKPFLYLLRSSSTIYFMGQFTGSELK